MDTNDPRNIHVKEEKPMIAAIRGALADKSYLVDIFGTPDNLTKLKKLVGEFNTPKYVPKAYIKGGVHINIRGAKLAKTYLDANFHTDLLW